MANLERLKELREAVLNHPDKWNQTDWVKQTACGTTMCFAGFCAELAGREFSWGVEDIDKWIEDYGSLNVGILKEVGDEVYPPHVSDFARGWLDLTHEEVSDLFWETDNDRAMNYLDTLIEREEYQAAIRQAQGES